MSCRNSRVCSICGASGLTLECQREDCSAVVHTWCLETQGLLERVGILCPLHTSKRRGDRTLIYPVSQVIEKPSSVREFKRSENHLCTGTVFWYSFCSQYYPWLDQAVAFPQFTLWEELDEELEQAIWEQDRSRLIQSSRSIDDLVSSLSSDLVILQSSISASQFEILTLKDLKDESDAQIFASVLGPFAIHRQMKSKTTEDDWVLRDIKMLQFKCSNKEYLRYFEERERVVMPEPQSRCARSLEPPKNEEDIVCCVCGDGDYEDDNLIVICEVRAT